MDLITIFENIGKILSRYWYVFLVKGVGYTLLLSVIVLFFGAILGSIMAIGKGLLSLDDTLEKFFPYVPDDKKNITVKNLMTHTSGMLRRPYTKNLGLGGRESVAKFIFSNPLVYETGTHFAYCCDGIMILGLILEMVFDMPLEDVFET